MIDLYYWPTPNGWKVTIALEEMGLPYEIIPLDITRGAQLAPEYVALNPNHRMPAIVDRDPIGGGEPIAVWESGAILMYLAEKSGTLGGTTARERYDVLQWVFWQMSALGPMLGQLHHFAKYAPEKVPYAIDRYQKESDRLYGVLDRGLAAREYLAGSYSVADIASYAWARGHKSRDIDITQFPNVKAWLDRVGARPAVTRGMTVGKHMERDLDEGAKQILFGQTSQTARTQKTG